MSVTLEIRRGSEIILSQTRTFPTKEQARDFACVAATRLEAQARIAKAVLDVKLS
jgi:hypothetical protein